MKDVYLKEISFWGWLKLQLFMDLALLFSCLPILGVAYLINPEAINYNGPTKFFIFEMEGTGLLFYLLGMFLIFIGYIIKATIFWVIVKFTPVAKITLNKY